MILGVIPARFASSRFPGKPLALIAGRPMIEWVYEQASKAKSMDRVLVATDDDRIAASVRSFGGQVMMTSAQHPSGTDRLAEVARQTAGAEIIVNIQGDEPLIAPESIDLAVERLQSEPAAAMSTLVSLAADDDYTNSHVVKAVIDSRGFALYFSRAPIPHRRYHIPECPVWKHIGLYAYRRDFLLNFAEAPPSPLERTESLEQLRALEMGHRIVCAVSPYDSLGVDTPEDLQWVEALLAARPAPE